MRRMFRGYALRSKVGSKRVAVFPTTALFAPSLCVSTSETAHIATAETQSPTTSAPTTAETGTEGLSSSIYLSFMGASSRFTYASRIGSMKSFTKLEEEPLSHNPPGRVNDHCCIYLVKLLRWCADKLFRERYLHRATMLKIIASAPPLAGAMSLHVRMMFTKQCDKATFVTGHSGFAAEMRGLLTQAESHACHTQLLMAMTDINYAERALALFLQSVHFTMFLLLFLLYPRMAFRLLGYLGEESAVLWTHMINDVVLGKVGEREVPQAALDYWGLRDFKVATLTSAMSEDTLSSSPSSHSAPSSSELDVQSGGEGGSDDTEANFITLREVALLIRSDEMIWRDVSHKMADDIDQVSKTKKTFLDLWF